MLMQNYANVDFDSGGVQKCANLVDSKDATEWIFGRKKRLRYSRGRALASLLYDIRQDSRALSRSRFCRCWELAWLRTKRWAFGHAAVIVKVQQPRPDVYVLDWWVGEECCEEQNRCRDSNGRVARPLVSCAIMPCPLSPAVIKRKSSFITSLDPKW